MPSKGRHVTTSCDVCGSPQRIVVRLEAKNLRRDRARLRRAGPDKQALLAEFKRALGLRETRKDAGQPKPRKPKVRPAAVRKMRKDMRAVRDAGKQAKEDSREAAGLPRQGKRPCGCKATGRHRKACTLATDHVAPKGWTKSENAAAKLANANKASPDGEGPRKRLSDKGKAAIAALDPVRKPIKAGA